MPAQGQSRPTAPPLPLPAADRIVRVSTEPQLQAAVRYLKTGTTIVLAPGRYRLSKTLALRGVADVTLRGESGTRESVVLEGSGMGTPNDAAPYGIWTGAGVERLTVANLTIRDFYRHALIFNAGTQQPHVYNVRLVDIGEQFIKSNPGGPNGAVHRGIVEYSVLEYTRTARSDYTNGIDVHGGKGWVIRRNVFRNIQAPDGRLAGPAVLVWNHARDTVTEDNLFFNCARGISYGLVRRDGYDHQGGLIRNNVVHRAIGQAGDVGIHVADSPGTRIVQNTVYLGGSYPAPIEVRFNGSVGVVVGNNLSDGPVVGRDGAMPEMLGNITNATAAFFVDAAQGDVRLVPGARRRLGSGSAGALPAY